MHADLSYAFDGLFVVILPESRAGEAFFNAHFAEPGSHKVMGSHFAAFRRAVAKAGYALKARKADRSATSDADLLAALA